MGSGLNLPWHRLQDLIRCNSELSDEFFYLSGAVRILHFRKFSTLKTIQQDLKESFDMRLL
jgi:hypothetical protein